MSADQLSRFSFEDAPIRGQWVRLEGVIEQVCARQSYPPVVRSLIAEMLGAVAMLADTIKFDGAVTLHSRSSVGPLTTLMAECRSRQLLRGIARWDDPWPAAELTTMSELLGDGRLAISLLREDSSTDPGVSYQGLIELQPGNLARNLEAYFASSEQLPSRVFFAARGASTTGLLLQRLPAPARATALELDQHEACWREVSLLADRMSAADLATLAPSQLLSRLSVSHPINLQPPRTLQFGCTCNRQKTSATLRVLGRSELLALLESDAEITVTCEFCGQVYRYDAVDVHLLLEPGNTRIH